MLHWFCKTKAYPLPPHDEEYLVPCHMANEMEGGKGIWAIIP